MTKSALRGSGLALLLVAVGFGLWSTSLDAADHSEAPGVQADAAADINDLYAWHTADGTAVTIITFGGITNPETPVYDPDVLYGINSDTDGDNEADARVAFRFGMDADGNWGIQTTMGNALGMLTFEGPVGEVVTDPTTGAKVWAGAADDPFFFDLQGFTDTLANTADATDATDIAFTATDALAGANVTAIVFEGPAPGAAWQVWATSQRDNG
ncbi:MAG: DUF4331 family protein [Myxococcota bacterium]|nr:DUF4331 family protein [Myxococcota bacterium]